MVIRVVWGDKIAGSNPVAQTDNFHSPFEVIMPANSQFKVGDVVVLKSGGPQMTVFKIGWFRIRCMWIDGCSITKVRIPQDCLRLS